MNRLYATSSTVVLFWLAAAALAACMTLHDNPVIAQAGVQVASARFVRSAGDAEHQAKRKERVKAIAGEIQSLARNQMATVDFLHTAVNQRLPADLNPEDRVLVELLISAVVQELQKRVGDGVLDPERLMQLDQVLAWIIQGADLVAVNEPERTAGRQPAPASGRRLVSDYATGATESSPASRTHSAA